MKRRRRAAATITLLGLFLWVTPVAARTASTPLPLDSHLSECYKDDLNGLIKRRYIRVLTALSKTNFFISRGRPFGFEYALLKEYEEFLNRSFDGKELDIVLEFIPVERDELIPDLIQGYGDIAAAGLTVTAKRQTRIDFTSPYLNNISEQVVTYKGGFKPERAEDLSGHYVFVRESSSYYESLSALNSRLRALGKLPVEIVKAPENLATEDILEIVNTGAIEATVSKSHVAGIWSKILNNLEVHETVNLRTGGRVAWGVRKDNPELKASLNRFLAGHRRGTRLGNIYFNRYYRENPWIKNPVDPAGRKKFESYKSLFQKYAKRYGFDWVLIMAIAYQETRLDHNEESPSGAVGIMQVQPETARDRRIGIDDVYSLEGNIHAGVKYLALIRDMYFDDPGIRPRDRVRLAIAAYNAGPTKILRIRKLAAEMGLNPDRWFRNVELAALRAIGQETIRYVSNINKYYIIYRQVLIKKGEL